MARVQNLDLYKVLDVEEGVDSARIQSSYRLRARNCHPDRHPGQGVYIAPIISFYTLV